jgi:hypothetical protein
VIGQDKRTIMIRIINSWKIIAALTLLVLMGTLAWSEPGGNPVDFCTIKVPQPRPVDLTVLAQITVDQILTIMRSAYPKEKVQTVALEVQNGCLVYAVNLSSGPTILIAPVLGSFSRTMTANRNKIRNARLIISSIIVDEE